MDFEAVKAWLAQQVEKRAQSCQTKAMFGFILAPIAVIVSSACVFLIAEVFTHDESNNFGNPLTCLWISLAVIPFTFLGNRLIRRRNLMEERMSGDSVDAALARTPFGRAIVIVYFFQWILFTGPRLVDWGRDSNREARRWRALDNHNCAAVLWLLASRYKRVPFDEVQQEIPWLDLPNTIPELMNIPGVLNLKGPPPALALSDDLRKVIRTGGDLEAGHGDVQLS